MTFYKLLVWGLFFLVSQKILAQKINYNTMGHHKGYYYSFWSDSTSGSALMKLKSKGRYKTLWTGIERFMAGKGWEIGNENRILRYKGKFQGGSNGFLSLYGWTKDSLIEYFVVENYGNWKPPGSYSLGSFNSDNGTYNIYKTIRIKKPSLVGTANYYQYWSVRTTKRSKGIITFHNHVTAWKKLGLNLGKVWGYQIMATEGNKSSGYADIKVKEVSNNR